MCWSEPFIDVLKRIAARNAGTFRLVDDKELDSELEKDFQEMEIRPEITSPYDD